MPKADVGVLPHQSVLKKLDKETQLHCFVVKTCVRYQILSNFYFSPNDSRSKTMKNVFYFI